MAEQKTTWTKGPMFSSLLRGETILVMVRRMSGGGVSISSNPDGVDISDADAKTFAAELVKFAKPRTEAKRAKKS